MASSLEAPLGLQHRPRHGWARPGIVVGVIVTHPQGSRACVDLEVNIRNEAEAEENGPCRMLRDRDPPRLQGYKLNPSSTFSHEPTATNHHDNHHG